jgi:hypothetical protein
MYNHVHRIERAVAAYQRTALEAQAAVRQKVLTPGADWNRSLSRA